MKKILLCIVIVQALFGVTPVYAFEKSVMVFNEISPRKDITEWRYKIINGRLYKRLWNLTRSRWETNWVAC